MGWRENIAALLGVSAYAPRGPGYGLDLNDPQVESIRENLGGNLAPQPTTQVRWYAADLESAAHAADAGDLAPAAQLYRAMRRDGQIAGLLGTLTSGLVRLPKRFYGADEIVASLKARNGTRSVFDDMFPPSELALLAADGRVLGIGVGELLPVVGRDFPVMVRLEPEFLNYRWAEGRWYYKSIAGPLPITPGDGRWVLHTPGGRVAPWMNGLWPALGRAFINKEHALLHRSNYSAKLANAARVAVAPQGATDTQKQAWFQRVMAWGVNTVFGMTPGYDVKLLESNGRGFDVFQEEIDTCNNEITISISGQTVTVDGGAGFQNSDIHKSIRADIIQDVGEGLSYTLNTQGIPPWVVQRFGLEALATGASCEWDVRPPADLKSEAESYGATAKAIVDLGAALKPYGRKIDLEEIVNRGGVPMVPGVELTATPAVAHLELASADIAKVVRVDELRASQGLPPIGDDRGSKTILELAPAPTAGAAEPSASSTVAPAALPIAELPASDDAPPTDESASALAAKMTMHKIARCEHGAVNRCRLCGIERVRDFEPGEDGAPSWQVAWRPISKEAA